MVKGFPEEDIALLEDGALVQVMEVGAIDLDMMDASTQDTFIDRFGQFLAGPKFPMQIVIATETQDIGPWIDTLTEAAERWERRLAGCGDGEERGVLERLMERAWQRVEWVERMHRRVSPLVQRYYLVIYHNPLPMRSRRRQLTEALYRRGKEELAGMRYYIAEGCAELGLSLRVLNEADMTALLSGFYRRRVKSLRETPKGALYSLMYAVEEEGTWTPEPTLPPYKKC